MKYILSIILVLVFSACNDSKENNASTQTLTNKDVTPTPIEQNSTPATPQETSQTDIEKPAVALTDAQASPEVIFNRCKSCHGNNAQLKALGASHVIQGWDVAKIENALKGYQNGTYGGSMKSVMAAQAKGLSNEEIQKVANYIHNL